MLSDTISAGEGQALVLEPGPKKWRQRAPAAPFFAVAPLTAAKPLRSDLGADPPPQHLPVVEIEGVAAFEHPHHPPLLEAFHHRDLLDALDIEELHRGEEGIVRGQHDNVAVADPPHLVGYPFLLLAMEDILHILERDDPGHLARGVDDREIKALAHAEDLQQFLDVGILADIVDLIADGGSDLQRFQDHRLAPLVDIDPFPAEIDGVDRILAEFAGHHGADDRGDHDRDDDLVVAGQLEQQEDGGHRGVGRRGEKGADADGGVGPRPGGQIRHEPVGDRPERPAEDGADEQRWGEHPAGPAGPEGDRGGDDLEQDQGEHDPGDALPMEDIFHILVAVAHHLREEDADAADQQGPGQRLELGVDSDCPVAVPDRVKDPDEQHRGQADEDRQQAVQGNLDEVIDHRIVGDGEDAHLAVPAAGDDGGHRRGDDQGGEGGNLVGTEEDDLGGEEDAGDRGVEHPGDAAGGPGGDEDLQPAAGDPEELTGLGPDRPADLGDRTLYPGRIAGADGQCGGDDLEGDAPCPDNAVLEIDLAEEGRQAVAVDLPREEQRQRNQQRHAGKRQQRQQQQIPAAPVDAEQAGAAVEDQGMDRVDQAAEDDGHQAGPQTDAGGDKHHPGVFTRQKLAEGLSHRFSGMAQPIAAAWLRKKSSVIPAM